MRFVPVLMLALAIGLQAGAETPPKRRAFVDRDYDTYFSDGVRHFTSPTRNSVGIDRQQTVNGRKTATSVEAAPKWNPASLYPYVKIVAAIRPGRGVWDKTLGARVYTITDAEFEEFETYMVWLSNNKQPEITKGDARVGSVRGYYRTLGKTWGQDPQFVDDQYRQSATGKWMFRCEWVTGETYDVECTQAKIASPQTIVIRFLKQDKLS